MLAIYIISICALLFFGYRITKKILNPVTIYNFVWLVIVLLYQLRISGLQQELSDDTMWLLLLKSVVFTVAFSFFYLVRMRKKDREKEDKHKAKTLSFKEVDYKKILIPLFVVWCVVEIVETIYSGGLPIVWKLVGDSRTYFDYGISTVHGLMNAIGLVIISLSTLLFLKANDRKKKMGYAGIIVLLLGFYLSLITRQVIISAIIQMFVIYLLVRKPYKKKGFYLKLTSIAVIGVIIFGVIGNFRTGYDNFLDVAVINSEVQLPQPLAGFYWVYMYLTMSLANINNAVVLGINHFGGLYPAARTFLPTVLSRAIFPPETAIRVPVPNYLVSQAFNVSGYFIDFYVGMGTLGVVLIAAIYGLLGGIIYSALRRRMSERNIMLYAVFVQIILLSFFFNHLFYLPSGFQLIIILAIYYIMSRNEVRHEKN
ncbi:oligosaccharide repeat unit polymerase [Candidatus Saccharibacteria bacterium]|nr:oligosaccharide repeat unit polymerase [Candidatus Saccharibacteria bacterium]